MTILQTASTSSIPAGYIEAACVGSSAAIQIPAGSTFPRCTACQRSDAEAEAQKLLADASDLRDGTGVYAALTADERQEQINALVLSTVDDTPPESRSIEELFEEFLDTLSGSDLEIMADLVARRIADRNRKPVASGTPTLVRVAIADLSDTALIDLIGTNDEPVLLNAATAEMARRLGTLTESYRLPIYSKPADADPTPRQRDEIESRQELVIAPLADEDPRAGSWDSDFAA